MKPTAAIIAFLAWAGILLAQDAKPVRENLGKNVNSIWDERAPVISPDGKTLYFTRGGDPSNTGYYTGMTEQDIWYSELRGDSTWSPAKNIGAPLNTIYPNSLCSVTPDGNTIMVLGVYNRNGTTSPGYSVSYRTGNGWSFPEKLNIENYYNYSKYSNAYMANDGKAILLAADRLDSYGNKDIYVSFGKGGNEWSKPENLGPDVNSSSEEYSPFLASDGKTLYFSSKRPGGFGGYDVYVTRRLDSTWRRWSKPENLGKYINSPEDDLFYKISSKGDYTYFLSYEDSYGQGDIFRILLPKKLRPEPVELVSGKVLDIHSGDPIDAKIYYETLPDYEEVGTARTDPKTGSYKITLPLGKKYRFYASARDYIASGGTIDLTSSTEYKEVNKNIELSMIEAGQVMTLENLYFAKNESSITDDHKYIMDYVVQFMNGNPNADIMVKAYSSPGEAPGTAEKRAKAAAAYLISRFIPKRRVSTRVFPDFTGKDDNDSRKVEFKIKS